VAAWGYGAAPLRGGELQGFPDFLATVLRVAVPPLRFTERGTGGEVEGDRG